MILAILVSCTNPPPVRPTAVELTDTIVMESPIDPVPVAVVEPALVEPAPVEAVVTDAPSQSPVPEPPTVSIAVRSGESLVLLADFANLRAEDIADMNGLDVKDAIVPGQLLRLGAADETDFLARRDAWLAGKVDRYVERRGGVIGVENRRVGTGDTAWSIARDEGRIPMWIVAYYNPQANLDQLGIGDHLTLPIFGDTVADAAVPAEGPVE